MKNAPRLSSCVAWIALALAACASSGGSSSSASTSGPDPSASAGDFPSAPYASFAIAGTELSAELRTSPTQPPERGVIAAELRIIDAAGAPRDGLAIDVVPWMVAHGHGSSVVPLVTPLGGGVYRIDRMQLAMPGTWQLRFTFTAANLDAAASTMLSVQ